MMPAQKQSTGACESVNVMMISEDGKDNNVHVVHPATRTRPATNDGLTEPANSYVCSPDDHINRMGSTDRIRIRGVLILPETTTYGTATVTGPGVTSFITGPLELESHGVRHSSVTAGECALVTPFPQPMGCGGCTTIVGS
eukprot:1363237-Rhodomonas_salina.1